MEKSSNNFILPITDKFYNWVYPTFENVISTEMTHPKEELSDFVLSQGQKFVRQFLLNSPYRAILLFHGLGTGKTCSAIIASEELISEKHILLFIPASLKQNWLNELFTCGNPLYTNKNEIYKNYTFINYNSSNIKHVYNSNGIVNNFYLGSIVNYMIKDIEKKGKIIKINSGVFDEKNYNITDITVQVIYDSSNQNLLESDNIITEEINIINNNITLDIESNKNPFDNKIIIFDEFHNFILTITNISKKVTKLTTIQQTKMNIYNDLKNAQNCKIILLSGTPIVNNSYELSYISNILNGNNIIYKFEYIINSKKIISYIDKIKSNINNNIDYINYVNIEYFNNYIYIYIIFNPDYFYNINNNFVIKKNNTTHFNSNQKINIFKVELLKILEQYNLKPIFIKVKKNNLSDTYIPENTNDFISKFLISEYDTTHNINYFKSIKNINILKTLLAGKVSYIKGEIPTKSIKYNIHIPMGQEQENKYLFVRSKEIESAKKSSKSNSSDDSNLSSLRSKSRQLCNIYIPINDINLNNNDDTDDDSNDLIENINSNNDIDNKINKFIKTYFDINKEDYTTEFYELTELLQQEKLNSNTKKIIELEKQLENSSINIILNKINKYTNKFSFLIHKLINSSNKDFIYDDKIYPSGKVLIYSDFRETKSGGVNFISKLLQIRYFKFKSFNELLLDNIDYINQIFNSSDEKSQFKSAYFDSKLKNKLIELYILFLDSEPLYKNKIYYLWQTSNNKSLIDNYIAHIIYNSDENKDGSLLRIIFITKSGSEGISFKAIRQIHIIEPYWQLTRNTQVVGRGIRYKSHNQLDIEKHNVFVYNYLSIFNNNTIYEEKLTTDQYITAVSYKKQSIIDNFYDILKSVSLDCPYNNEFIDCYSYNNIFYNNDLNTNPIYLNHNINNLNIEKTYVEAKLIDINSHKYIIHHNIIYDYEKYSYHNILIKIGHISKDGNNNILFNITRTYNNNYKCYIETNFTLNLTNNNFNSDYLENINIDNNITYISKLINGGYIDSYESNNNDVEYISDNEYYTSSDSDNDDDDENIDDNNDDNNDDNDDMDGEIDLHNNVLTKLKEIEKRKNILLDKKNNDNFINMISITFNIKSIDYIYKINDYIFLYDFYTNERIIAGKINQITNKFILVNDIRIPILKDNSNNNFILYKIKLKNIFLNEIGNHILNLYLSSNNINLIYDKYQKNKVLDKIILLIYNKIKLNYTIDINFNTDNENKTELNKDLIDNIIKVVNESETNSNDIENTVIDIPQLINTSKLNELKENTTEYEEIINLYKNIIYNYFLLYQEYLDNNLKTPLYSNNTLKVISLHIIKNEKDNSDNPDILEENRLLYLDIIKYYLLFETSIIIQKHSTDYHIFSDQNFKGIIKNFITEPLVLDTFKEKISTLKKEFKDQYIIKINELLQTINIDINESNETKIEIFNNYLDNIEISDNKVLYNSQKQLLKLIYNLNIKIHEYEFNIYDVEKLLLKNNSQIINILDEFKFNLLDYIKNNTNIKNIEIKKKKKESSETTDTIKTKKSKKKKSSSETTDTVKTKKSKKTKKTKNDTESSININETKSPNIEDEDSQKKPEIPNIEDEDSQKKPEIPNIEDEDSEIA